MIKFICSVFLLIFGIIFTSSGSTNGNLINLKWYIDNDVSVDALNSALHDFGWHLVTIKVSELSRIEQPIKLDGITGKVDTSGFVDKGQLIEVKDLNCKNAVFSKVGDECSVYFHFDVKDVHAIDNIDDLLFPTHLYLNGDFSASVYFVAKVYTKVSILNTRVLAPVEIKNVGKYVIENLNDFQIIRLQNGSRQIILFDQIGDIINNKFRIMNRYSASDDDFFYGSMPECSSSMGSDTFKVKSVLINLNESCLLIFTAASHSSHQQESEALIFKTDDKYSFPHYNKDFSLLATYESMPYIYPIEKFQDRIFVDELFKGVIFDYKVEGSYIDTTDLYNNQTVQQFMLPYDADIQVGWTIISDGDYDKHWNNISRIDAVEDRIDLFRNL